MFFGGITPTSTVDWPGKVSMVIFFRGCVLRCPYCSNHSLWEMEGEVNTEYVFAKIDEAVDFIDAIILSGGEPFLQLPELIRVAEHAKKRGLLVGVETSGIFPDRLQAALKERVIDAVFLDVKAPLTRERYMEVTGFDVVDKVKKSIEVCQYSNAYFEVRTTIFKGICDTPEELREIAKIKCDRLVLQRGNPELAHCDMTGVSQERVDELGRIIGIVY